MYLFNKTINKLLKANVTIATAESCTGGLLSYSFIKNKGVSKIFITGLICYSDTSKIQFLKIKKNTLKKYGAVSQQISKEMTQNLSKITGCVLSITTTGIAGPTGNSKNKPIGLVYIGIKYKKKIKIFKKNFNGSRIQIQKKNCKFYFQTNSKFNLEFDLLFA